MQPILTLSGMSSDDDSCTCLLLLMGSVFAKLLAVNCIYALEVSESVHLNQI